jgi:hypothetical protein
MNALNPAAELAAFRRLILPPEGWYCAFTLPGKNHRCASTALASEYAAESERAEFKLKLKRDSDAAYAFEQLTPVEFKRAYAAANAALWSKVS